MGRVGRGGRGEGEAEGKEGIGWWRKNGEEGGGVWSNGGEMRKEGVGERVKKVGEEAGRKKGDGRRG